MLHHAFPTTLPTVYHAQGDMASQARSNDHCIPDRLKAPLPLHGTFEIHMTELRSVPGAVCEKKYFSAN